MSHPPDSMFSPCLLARARATALQADRAATAGDLPATYLFIEAAYAALDGHFEGKPQTATAPILEENLPDITAVDA